MSGADAWLPLSGQDLREVSEFLYLRTGMIYGERKRYFIERRLALRMERSGLATVGSYLKFLLSSQIEAEEFINSFTVNETYFYREDDHFRCLSRSILPELIKQRGAGDLVRIWSIPCSTGEEPYSMAIWLLENWPLVDAYNIEIEGSDIDTRALAAASVGDYGERALSRLPPDVTDRYFEPGRGGQRRIIQDLRESVTFTQANLVDSASMGVRGVFDVIFCRNVLIYFDDASRFKASQNLLTALRPGGFICLGHAESMTRISNRFETCRFDDVIVHRRPVA